MRQSFFSLLTLSGILLFGTGTMAGNDTLRTMRYSSRPAAEALSWQSNLRAELINSLNIGDLMADKIKNPLAARELGTEDKGTYLLKEVSLQSTPGRRITVLVTIPKTASGPWPAVVCIHGHGGQIRSVYDKASIYKGFADALANGQYVTIAPVVSQHTVAENGRLLMGERTWDLLRCVDYLEELPGVDRNRIGCAGLSLGGEMSMWLGALDTRIRATVSCGFLTRMDQLEKNHCMCWKFPGLRQLVDFTDIYSLTAPRALQCQNGWKESPTQFYVPIAKETIKEIESIYRDLGHPERLELDVHDGGHEVDLPALLSFLEKYLSAGE
jgi:esterase/lipase